MITKQKADIMKTIETTKRDETILELRDLTQFAIFNTIDDDGIEYSLLVATGYNGTEDVYPKLHKNNWISGKELTILIEEQLTNWHINDVFNCNDLLFEDIRMAYPDGQERIKSTLRRYLNAFYFNYMKECKIINTHIFDEINSNNISDLMNLCNRAIDLFPKPSEQKIYLYKEEY